jgi:hypothetical protein
VRAVWGPGPGKRRQRRTYTGPRGLGTRASVSSVLTDDEAEAIREKLAEGWRGPVILRWLEQLLKDREERRQRERESERQGF